MYLLIKFQKLYISGDFLLFSIQNPSLDSKVHKSRNEHFFGRVIFAEVVKRFEDEGKEKGTHKLCLWHNQRKKTCIYTNCLHYLVVDFEMAKFNTNSREKRSRKKKQFFALSRTWLVFVIPTFGSWRRNRKSKRKKDQELNCPHYDHCYLLL